MEIVQKYKNNNAVLICKSYKIYELKRQNLMLKIKNCRLYMIAIY